MKESGRVANNMVKVEKYNVTVLILTFFDASIGKFFWSDGDRYEGELENEGLHGQGKRAVILLFNFFILTVLDASIVKCFLNDGNRYEGEYKYGKKHGHGKKRSFGLILTLFLENIYVG